MLQEISGGHVVKGSWYPCKGRGTCGRMGVQIAIPPLNVSKKSHLIYLVSSFLNLTWIIFSTSQGYCKDTVV